jgi:DNA-binding NarL/FixJ family response regulator
VDEAAWEVAFEEGQAMSFEGSVEYALSEKEVASLPTVPQESPASESPQILTRREREIATLVARGLTNRQIASELMISKYTVATHVAKILKKLDLHSRPSSLRGCFCTLLG